MSSFYSCRKNTVSSLFAGHGVQHFVFSLAVCFNTVGQHEEQSFMLFVSFLFEDNELAIEVAFTVSISATIMTL